MLPIVHGLERKFGDHITFVRLSIHNPDSFALQEQLGFTVTPEFFLLDAGGAVLAHWDEGLSVEGVEQVLAGLLYED